MNLRNHRTARKMAGLEFSERCDVTTQDELGDLARTLNFLAERLDATLTELRQANEKLAEDLEREKKLERMRRDFVAGVSHELKTPIMLIESYAEGLKYGVAKGRERAEYLEVILEEAQRMESMVREMLDLARLESGAAELVKEPLELGSFVEKFAAKYARHAEAMHVRLETSVSEKPMTVLADASRIEQVLSNLIVNALRHTPEGGAIAVRVTTRAGSRNGSARVDVENDGEPIADEDLDRIWEQFYRADPARSRGYRRHRTGTRARQEHPGTPRRPLRRGEHRTRGEVFLCPPPRAGFGGSVGGFLKGRRAGARHAGFQQQLEREPGVWSAAFVAMVFRVRLPGVPICGERCAGICRAPLALPTGFPQRLVTAAPPTCGTGRSHHPRSWRG